MAPSPEHWNGIYGARAEDELTWFEETPSVSLELVRRYLPPGNAFLDVGAGASRLVDTLLEEGFGPLAVMDLSGAALAASRQRLGDRSNEVTWVEADVTRWKPDQTYALWHDRAVFHFLTEAVDRAAYAQAMTGALNAGGFAIIATFADDGPEKCSGLPVIRYTPERLARELDRLLPNVFEMIEAKRHMHITPKGNRQSFQYSVFKKKQD